MSELITSSEPSVDGVPESFSLGQNFPNPFNPTTVIRYRLPSTASVSLGVYDVFGREVASLVDGVRNPGEHEVVFDATGLSTGVYVYRIRAGSFSEAKKLALIK